MAQIPNWWLYLSGAFFLVAFVYLGALTFAVLKVVALAQDNAPRIARIEGDVSALVEKARDVATTVEKTAHDVQQRVGSVGNKAENVAGSVERVTSSATKQFAAISPFLMAGLSVFRIVQYFRAKKSRRLAALPASGH